MLHPKRMSHLVIVCSKTLMDDVIKELYSHNVFHIQEFVEREGDEYRGVTIGKPFPQASEASSQLIRIRSIENTFNVRSGDVVPKKRVPVQQLKKTIDTNLAAIGNEVEQLLAKKSACDTAVKDLLQRINELRPFISLPLNLEMYSGYGNLAVFTGKISKKPDFGVENETYFSQTKEGSYIAVFVPVVHSGQVQQTLTEANFMAIPIPKGEGSPQEIINSCLGQIDAQKQEIARIQERIETIKKEQVEFLAACEELLTADVEQAEAPLRFAITGEAFIVEGWVPAEEVERLKSGMALATESRAFVTEIHEDGDHHHAPVEYHNPPFAQPTELLIDTHSRPRYDEIDPTLVVSIVFPLFFGIILGDIGYGALLLVVSMGLRRFLHGDGVTRLLNIMRNASISSIFFGVLFSEFFGFALPWNSMLPSRHLNIGTHATGHGPAVTELLVFAVWIGIVQITLGRILSAANHYHHREMRGVAAAAGWIAAMWGILLLIWSMSAMPLMPSFVGLPPVFMGLSAPALAGAVMVVLGLVGIAGENPLELIEIPSIISNTMSYARLVAVGLSSVAIAMVVNFIAIGMLIEPQFENLTIIGVLMIIMGIAVLIGGHLLNTALGLIGSGLHSLRLQYVEFFTKFYKGGGEKYHPFGLKRRFTED
ncbi:MAG: V-type ATP synthase subunit I [Methanoregula sp.]|nr:MAG: V-type ATP synthase subunit I [Methanoregula sp.]